jgi:hypothetical protein
MISPISPNSRHSKRSQDRESSHQDDDSDFQQYEQMDGIPHESEYAASRHELINIQVAEQLDYA